MEKPSGRQWNWPLSWRTKPGKFASAFCEAPLRPRRLFCWAAADERRKPGGNPPGFAEVRLGAGLRRHPSVEPRLGGCPAYATACFWGGEAAWLATLFPRKLTSSAFTSSAWVQQPRAARLLRLPGALP